MPSWINTDISIGLRIRGYEVALPNLNAGGFPFKYGLKDAVWLFSHLKNAGIIPRSAELVKIDSPVGKLTIILVTQDSSYEPSGDYGACPVVSVNLVKKGDLM